MTERELVFGIFMSLNLRQVDITKLSALTEPFDIHVPYLRTVLSRMHKSGLLEIHREGKRAFYSLTDRGDAIGDNVARGFGSLDWARWRGEYRGVLFTFPENNNPTRYKIRKKLEAYRYAPLIPGFWIRPVHPHGEEPLPGDVKELCRIIRLTPQRKLSLEEADELWQLSRLREHMHEAMEEMNQMRRQLTRSSPKEAFRCKMLGGDIAVKALARDPLLPPELLPNDWPASRLKAAFKSFNEETTSLAEAFWREILEADG